MEFKKTSEQFWVIFDTSQYPPYYGDVHELLATPSGVIMRYQYRENLMTPEAVALAGTNGDTNVLLAYIQHDTSYTRTDQHSDPVVPSASRRVIPTRLGTMLNVMKDGIHFYFDFVVQEYPKCSAALIDHIFDPLMGTGQAPPDKWVSTSRDWLNLELLAQGDPAENWQGIVDSLGKEPIQFARDAFWRIQGPLTKSGRIIEPRTVKERANGRTRQLRSEFVMLENRTWKFQLISSVARDVPPDRPNFSVQVKSTDPTVLNISGSGQFDVRHYDERSIEYSSEPMPPFRNRSIDIVLTTDPGGVWPMGPRVSIRHIVRKSHLVSIIGVLAGVATVLLGVIGGSELFKNDVLNGIRLVCAGLASGVIAKYMLTGKLEFGK